MNNKEKGVFDNLIFLVQLIIERNKKINNFIQGRSEWEEAMKLKDEQDKVKR